MVLTWSSTIGKGRYLNNYVFARQELAKAFSLNLKEADDLYRSERMERKTFTEDDIEKAAIILERWGCSPQYS
jgi:hypothetical protein